MSDMRPWRARGVVPARCTRCAGTIRTDHVITWDDERDGYAHAGELEATQGTPSGEAEVSPERREPRE